MKKEEVHPRPCGEYGVRLSEQKVHKGSPPLTRGIRRSWLMMVRCLRFTPAHAGNTPFLEKNNSCYEVHPRSRGEYLQNPNHLYKCLGSPALTLGILTGVKEKYPAARFTPAHAGNTILHSSIDISKRVHPRSRGEYSVPPIEEMSKPGSPPLTRGIRNNYEAYAEGERVHPRSRGEYDTGECAVRAVGGSPPLTRGILRCTRFRLLLIRVHPRSRGEYRLSRSACNRFLGSPPLTRGIRRR